ncbi:MAG TPA: hypothetical protein VGK19_19550 [Capsulimonadaceae bacterium]|jgi:hypothetical protein
MTLVDNNVTLSLGIATLVLGLLMGIAVPVVFRLKRGRVLGYALSAFALALLFDGVCIIFGLGVGQTPLAVARWLILIGLGLYGGVATSVGLKQLKSRPNDHGAN